MLVIESDKVLSKLVSEREREKKTFYGDWSKPINFFRKSSLKNVPSEELTSDEGCAVMQRRVRQ